MNWTLLQNSLLVSGLTMLLATAFGLVAALWLAGLETSWRARWLGVAIAALCLPPFVATNCWVHYLGLGGVWHRWLPVNLYSLGGTVWILALLNWPIPLLAALGAWERLEAAQLECDPAATGLALIRGLLLPLARGALLQAAVLAFVLALNNFTVPAILQVKVFPAEVWVQFNTTFNTLAALQLSWPMVVMPLLLLAWFRRREAVWPRVEGPVSPRLFRQQLGRGWFWFCGICTMLLAAFALGFPVMQLVTAPRTWTELPGALAAGQSAVWHSLGFAVVTATLCLALGLAGWRWPVGLALWVPFLIPGVLLGIGLIAVFNRPALSAFYQSPGIVLLAFGIRYLAFGWNGAARAMGMTDRDLNDAAQLGGASRWQMLRHVHWPQISSQMAAVWYIIFLLCLWDVESMVLIVPPGGQTLALRVFNLLHYGRNPQVNALCLTLLVLAVTPLVLWRTGRWLLAGGRSGAAVALACAALGLAGCSQEASNERAIASKIFDRVRVIGARGVGIGQFNKPRSVAVDRADNVYVADWTGRIQKFSAEGQFLLSWQMAQTNAEGPKGMCCDKNGNIVIVEPHYQRVNVYQPNGKLVERWGEQGTNAGHLVMPRAAAVNSHGNILISEYTVLDRVQEFSAHGKELIRVVGHSGAGPGEFSRPEGLCVDSADRIYVADSCNHRVQVFAPDGKWLRSHGQAGGAAGDFSYPYDIQVDADGRQYVCEFGNSRVQIFDANDRLVEILGHAGGAPGEFSNPWGLALDSHGNLYVADTENHRVQKFLRRKDVAGASGSVRPGDRLKAGLQTGTDALARSAAAGGDAR